jgi:hypothetical protein
MERNDEHPSLHGLASGTSFGFVPRHARGVAAVDLGRPLADSLEPSIALQGRYGRVGCGEQGFSEMEAIRLGERKG